MTRSAGNDQLKYRRLAVNCGLSLRRRACSSAVEQGTHNLTEGVGLDFATFVSLSRVRGMALSLFNPCKPI